MKLAIIRHEMRQVIFNRKAWICLAAIQSLLAIIFNWSINKYLQNQTMLTDVKYGITEEVIHPYYAWFSLLVLFFMPMLATQALCAEKVQRTIVNYRTAPITATQVIIGKFLAINFVLLLVLAIISVLPLTVVMSGALDWGQLAISLLGAYLVLSAALAIGLACSSVMHNITRSNIAVFFALLFFILLEWAAQFTGKHAMFLQTFGLLTPLKTFLSGVLSVKHFSYYLLLISLFIMVAIWGFKRWDTNA